MSAKSLISSLAIAGALALPLCAHAASPTPWNSTFGMSPFITTDAAANDSGLADSTASNSGGASATTNSQPVLLDDAPPAPNIHGFFNSPFRTAYVTPRGLVVENAGLVWQPVGGLVLPLGDFGMFKDVAFVGGIWNSVNSAQQDPFVGAWNEMDVFVSLNAKVGENFSLGLTYSPWNSPPHAFHTEHNADLKISYDDSKMYGSSGFALHPYADVWWAISGDSTVILGQRGGTGYLELGVAPTFTFKAAPDYPVTITIPMYTQVGPRSYWAASNHVPGGGMPGGNVGLFSVAANASVPLAFIPSKYGFWHADAGITYDYLVNETLLHAGTLASGNTNHNVIIASLGFGVNF